jgi:hypothetical protein
MSFHRPTFVAGFFLFLVVFVVGGALLAAGQLDNLGAWPYWRVLPLGVALVLAGAGAMVLLGTLLPRRLRPALVSVLQALTIIALATTAFLPMGVQRLDGASGVPPNRWAIALVWGGYLAGALLLARLLARGGVLQRLFRVAASISVVVVVAVAVLFATSKSTQLEELRTSSAPLPQLYEFGTKRNVVVVMMDMLQGSFLEQALDSDPLLARRFGDFTTYTRAVSTFPFTNYSLPSLLSGVPYASPADKRFVSNLPAAVADSFLHDAGRKGYQVVGVQSVPFLPVSARNVPGFHIPADPAGAPRSYEGYMSQDYAVELAYGSLVRVLKMDFRGALGWEDELTGWKESGRRLLQRWADNGRLGTTENKVFLVHNLITHAPIVYERNGARLADSGKYAWTHPNLLGEIGFSLDLLERVFARMKALGVYDDALILVVGDHGHFMGYYDPKVYVGTEDFQGFKSGGNFRPAATYNPAMMVKAPHAGAGGVSRAAIGLVDVRAIVAAYLETGSVDVGQVLAQRRAAQPIPVATCLQERNPYFSAECHRLVAAPGNASTLPALFEDLQ